jgi:hypothetical protein
MTNWRVIFDLRGLNYWLIGSVLGWNLLADFGLLILSFQVLRVQQSGVQLIQLVLIAGVFLSAALGGFVAGRMAGDGRGPAYGVYGSLSSVLLLLYILVPSGGVLGFIVALSAILGGLNGGLFSGRVSR